MEEEGADSESSAEDEALVFDRFAEGVSRFENDRKDEEEEEELLPLRPEYKLIERKLKQTLLLGRPLCPTEWTRVDGQRVRSLRYLPKLTVKQQLALEEERNRVKKNEEKLSRLGLAIRKYEACLKNLDLLRVEAKKQEFDKMQRKLRKQIKFLANKRTSFPKPAWIPPQSPFKLVQETLYEDPWKVVIACILLNKTTGEQMKKMIWKFFEDFPTPEAAIQADVHMLQNIIRPLGLFRVRAETIKEFSRQYLYSDWTEICQLTGVGTYAEDAYKIFVEGAWDKVVPDDHKLESYWNWLHDLQREPKVAIQ